MTQIEEKQRKIRRFKHSRKNKKEKENDLEEIMDDPREPAVKSSLIIMKYFIPELFLILFGLLGSGIMGATPIVMYKVLGGLMDGLQTSTGTLPSTSPYVKLAVGMIQSATFQGTVNRAALYMTFVAIASLVGGFISQSFLNLARDRIGTKLKAAYFDALLNQEIGFFDLKRTGQLISDMSDTELIQEGFTMKLGEIFRSVIQGILGVAIALDAGWKMSLVMLSTSPLLVVVLLTSGTMVRFFVAKTNEKTSGAAAVANEVISSMRTVRSMDGEEKEKARYSKELRKAHPWFVLKASAMGLSLGIGSFIIWGTVALGFWFGGKLIIQGKITIGEMFQVFGLSMIAVIGFLTALQFLPDVQKADPAIKTILKLVTREPALRVEGGVTPNKIVGHVEFKNVSFRYPTRPNVQVLKDFTLDIMPGQAVALVGASGSGKSTIVGLLERFYAAESGQIILDGTNLEDIDPRWLHRNIGIVTQEPTLFAGTIKENIKYAIAGVREVTDEEVYKAAEAANAHDFIIALPKGYDTMMGERGVSLSGGQKQRVAIARAMIQNPSLLLLDEATSALDTQSESIVQDALTKLMKGRTSIVIAHRLTTIVDSDMIVVMHKGEMKEKGTHQELMKIPDGYYARLAKKQMMRH